MIKNNSKQKHSPMKDISFDAYIAKELMGWKEIQAPQHDCDGPLPDQGLVLAPPEFDEDAFRCWPNRGVVPYTFFIGNKYTGNLNEAIKLIIQMSNRGYKFRMLAKKDQNGEDVFLSEFSNIKSGRKTRCHSPKAEMAICLAIVQILKNGGG